MNCKAKSKAYYLLIVGFLTLFQFSSFAQDQKKADSLRHIYEADTLNTQETLKILRALAVNEMNDLDLGLYYADQLIDLAQSENDLYHLYHGYLAKGNYTRKKADFKEALKFFIKSVETAIDHGFEAGEGTSYIAIADTYSEIGNRDNALEYYDKGIHILRKTNDQLSLASALFNAGDEYYSSEYYDKAMVYYEEAGPIFKAFDFQIAIGYYHGNIGKIHFKRNEPEMAEEQLLIAIDILEEIQDYYGLSEYLPYLSDIYLSRNDWDKALEKTSRSLELAETVGLKQQISESNLKMSNLYDLKGEAAMALKYYKDYITYRDMVKNVENVQEMADLKTEFEVSQKQVEVDLLNEQKRNQKIVMFGTIIGMFLVGLLAFGLFRRYKYIRRTNAIIAREKERSESLLLNILPEETAQELKEEGKVTARKLESVTVMFTDFKGFTKYSENLSPEELVQTVDYYFSKFDKIIDSYNLEKIKTIGDAYMCAGGLHQPFEHHALRMVRAAMECIEFVNMAKEDTEDAACFDIRIGINTGAVVSGVVGSKKFAYDIWGDAVNIAARMESNSIVGRINISESTYELVKDYFECEYRGDIEVKNHGSVKMYFVRGIKQPAELQKILNVINEVDVG